MTVLPRVALRGARSRAAKPGFSDWRARASRRLLADGAVVQRVKFRRETLLAFFERAGRALVGMEPR